MRKFDVCFLLAHESVTYRNTLVLMLLKCGLTLLKCSVTLLLKVSGKLFSITFAVIVL